MMPAVANAPAATAIQTRSKTIQSPQGQVSERRVVCPEPEGEPRDERERAERHERGEQQVGGRPELGVEALEDRVILVMRRAAARRGSGHHGLAALHERVHEAEQTRPTP